MRGATLKAYAPEELRRLAYVGRYLRHRFAPHVTYAADREDLAAELLLGRVDRFIDVGANDGFSLSNTTLFALVGAFGLCFEPNPLDYRRLRMFYLFNGRVECIEQGLSDLTGSVELRSDGLLSTMTATEDHGLKQLLSPFYNSTASLVTVAVDRLSQWLDRRPAFRRVDVASIDVEGHELNVLNGIDWDRHPRVARCLIIETHSENSAQSWRHRDYVTIDRLLNDYGYVAVAASANNTFWLHGSEIDSVRLKAAKGALPGYAWFA